MNSNFLTGCPTNFYIASGKGESDYKLVSFDNALIDAGVSGYNLLKVSSILPAGCKRKENVGLKEGSLLPTAFATISSNVPGEQISSAVAVGIPKNANDIGVIMEYSGKVTKEEAENTARSMTIEAMNNHNIQIDEVISTASSAVVNSDKYVSIVSVLSMW